MLEESNCSVHESRIIPHAPGTFIRQQLPKITKVLHGDLAPFLIME